MSRNNTVSKLINLIYKMSDKGLWLTYKQLEAKPIKTPLVKADTKALQSFLKPYEPLSHKRTFTFGEKESPYQLSSVKPKRADNHVIESYRKETNSVKPNFQSMRYQEDAR